jgi:hypothetical protein
MPRTKRCTKCESEWHHHMFYKDSSKRDGLDSWCKRCRKEYRHSDSGKRANAKARKKYHESDKYKETVKQQTIRHRKKHPEKYKARTILNHALRDGLIEKQPCHCGESEVEAHHDNYSRPLDVDWLCVKHHKELHRKEKNENTSNWRCA